MSKSIIGSVRQQLIIEKVCTAIGH